MNAMRRPGVWGVVALVVLVGSAGADVETHNALIGKRAPNIEADFAVNGKPVRLADLKGKVVLVAFVNLARGTSRGMMSQLQAWHREHQPQGLEVIAVTIYNCEFDQKLEALGAAARLNPVAERKLLAEYADDNHLQFRLEKVPCEEAKRVFKAYGIGPVPQFVLISPKGTIDLIRVGSNEKTVEAVEQGIKRLLGPR